MKTISRIIKVALLTAMPCISAVAQEESMVKNAMNFLETPYVAHTLEGNEQEELVINCDEVDCITFVEYVMAQSLTPIQPNGDQSETLFAEYLQKIRYRNGKINGYTSRLHYVTDWAANGVRNGLIDDITATRSSATQALKLNYMTTHTDLYPQLAASPANVEKMKQVEQNLSSMSVHYLPKAQVPVEGLNWIKDGDIIALTTNIPGLDVSHMGIAFYVDGKLTLIHASSNEKKVIVNPVTLSQMLNDSDKLTGIRVFRVKKRY